MTAKCPPPNYYLKQEYYKGKIECNCGVIIRQISYQNHLTTKTHRERLDNYLQYQGNNISCE